jgi:NAD-dependent dihydropyrimidine dehydrogenase PreA subunit
MINPTMKKNDCILYCQCGAGIIREAKQSEITTRLKNLSTDVYELHDLCALSLSDKDFLNTLEKTYDRKYIIACYPRAIHHLLKQNQIPLTNYKVYNYRELSADQISKALKEETSPTGSAANYEVRKSSLDVPAWYPVIDQTACTLCGQCARFCVFGVYKYNKKSLEVVNPLSCKNNCPACGRTCPASAIIFPRLPENSVLSGAQPGVETNSPEAAKKEGLFVMLNERNHQRRNIFRQDVMQLAEEEKRKAIEELKKRENQ